MSTHLDVIHVAQADGPTVWLSGDVYTVKLGARESGGSLAVIEGSVPPGAGPPAHMHADADEAFYVLSGELLISAGEQEYPARAGDLVFIPRGTYHRFRNTGLHPARQLLLYVPAGAEGFFREAGRLAEPGAPPPAPDHADNQRAAAIGERFGLFQAPGSRPAR
jgi:quercetin dioxygenase-like cupin family protein